MHAKQQDHPGMITVILFTPHAFLLDPRCKRQPRKQISRCFYDQITFRRLKRNGRPDRCIPADFQCVRIGRNYSAFFNTFSIQINPISRRHTFQAHRNVKLRRTVFQFYTLTSPVEHPCIFSGHIRRHPDKLPENLLFIQLRSNEFLFKKLPFSAQIDCFSALQSKLFEICFSLTDHLFLRHHENGQHCCSTYSKHRSKKKKPSIFFCSI